MHNNNVNVNSWKWGVIIKFVPILVNFGILVGSSLEKKILTPPLRVTILICFHFISCVCRNVPITRHRKYQRLLGRTLPTLR